VSEANKQVIRAFLDDVINQGRFDRANDLVKEDFVELDPLPGQQQGREGVTRFTWTRTHRDTFLGIPGTGKHVEVKGVVIDRLESGKMADSRILMDTISLLQQLGVVPAPPSAKA